MNFATERGIKLEPTVPYTPEQDGVAERGFRTIFEKVRCIVSDLAIPKNLWPELVRAIVYITNRSATSVLKSMTPIEALNRQTNPKDFKPPSVAHLKVLGCLTIVHIQKER